VERETLIHSHPEIPGGTPVFAGTRVPARTLFDYVIGGDSLDAFLDDFPGVRREQAIGILEQAVAALLAKQTYTHRRATDG
jgi:uncharacterized protein (DUF433 family)